MIIRLPFAVLLSIAAVLVPPSLAAPDPDRPNFVIIMADDMGFSDIGCYGGEIQTPHIDRLASEGLRFSQFYNCALCGPSRAALLTGLHPHQAGITSWTGLLNDRCVTLFEALNRAGYATGAAGRLDMITADNWHEPENIARHVDRFLSTGGHQGPGGNYFEPTRNGRYFKDGEEIEYPSGRYKTDLLTDFAVDFLRERDDSRPFLLYMGHHAPHWPLHAKEEDIAKYRSLYRELGWDAAREQRLERLVEEGLLPPDTKLSPLDARAEPWSESTPHLDWEAERMAVYAAQIDSLDQSVGRVMEALRAGGADSNTLVFFFSDNGATERTVKVIDKPDWTWRSDDTPTRGAGNDPAVMPGPADTFLSAGPAWSSLANTPFRYHKTSNHEGGIASPLIAWWPEVVEQQGGISGELSHIVDIMATCLDAAGEPYPENFDGREAHPLAGKSLLPVLEGRARAGHDSLCWATSGAKAVREGSWKLVAANGKPWELYDLDTDRSELNDLAAQHPERVAAMEKVFEEWHSR
ncbi:MAG: arylsulfatase [Verrucomicrobiales bacterium]